MSREKSKDGAAKVVTSSFRRFKEKKKAQKELDELRTSQSLTASFPPPPAHQGPGSSGTHQIVEGVSLLDASISQEEFAAAAIIQQSMRVFTAVQLRRRGNQAKIQYEEQQQLTQEQHFAVRMIKQAMTRLVEKRKVHAGRERAHRLADRLSAEQERHYAVVQIQRLFKGFLVRLRAMSDSARERREEGKAQARRKKDEDRLERIRTRNSSKTVTPQPSTSHTSLAGSSAEPTQKQSNKKVGLLHREEDERQIVESALLVDDEGDEGKGCQVAFHDDNSSSSEDEYQAPPAASSNTQQMVQPTILPPLRIPAHRVASPIPAVVRDVEKKKRLEVGLSIGSHATQVADLALSHFPPSQVDFLKQALNTRKDLERGSRLRMKKKMKSPSSSKVELGPVSSVSKWDHGNNEARLRQGFEKEEDDRRQRISAEEQLASISISRVFERARTKAAVASGDDDLMRAATHNDVQTAKYSDLMAASVARGHRGPNPSTTSIYSTSSVVDHGLIQAVLQPPPRLNEVYDREAVIMKPSDGTQWPLIELLEKQEDCLNKVRLGLLKARTEQLNRLTGLNTEIQGLLAKTDTGSVISASSYSYQSPSPSRNHGESLSPSSIKKGKKKVDSTLSFSPNKRRGVSIEQQGEVVEDNTTSIATGTDKRSHLSKTTGNSSQHRHRSGNQQKLSTTAPPSSTSTGLSLQQQRLLNPYAGFQNQSVSPAATRRRVLKEIADARKTGGPLPSHLYLHD